MALTKVTYGLLSADTSAIDLNIDANTLYVDSSANRVGIGTSSPAYFLHVKHANNTETVTESVGDYFPSTSIKRTGGSSKTNYYWEFQIGSSGNLNFKDRTNSYYPIILNASGDVLLGNNTSGANPTMFIDQSTGRVGIGTSSPGVHLDIESSTNNAQIEITATDGTDQSYGIFGATGNNSNGAGFYIQDKTASGSPIRFKIDTSGNVGIGTTAPTRRLSVKKDTTITSGFNDITEFLDTTIGAGGSVSLNVGRANSTRNLGKMAFKYAGAGSTSNALNFGFYDADNLMTLTAGGSLGIGTTSPARPLHVNGSARLSNGASLEWGGTSANIAGSSSTNTLFFRTASTERMRISSSGNVGIGETNPDAPLHITSNTPIIAYDESDTSQEFRLGVFGGAFALYDSNDTAFRMLVDGDGRVGIGTSAPTGQRLCIGGHSTSDTMTEANAWFVAEATGGDGIAIGSIASSPYTTWIQSGYLNTMGTSNHYPISLNPHDGLVLINSSTNIGMSNNVGGARYGHSFGGGQQVNSTNNDTNLILNMSNGYSNALVLFRYNGSTKGTISTNGSAVAYNTSSDYRLKQNEIAVWDGTTILKQLTPYKFNWKADPTGEAVQGFFAHEVAEVIPEVVSGEKDGEEMQGIDHSKLVPLLVKTIQELEARITELESK